MELDPHVLHQIIQKIKQQMRCPQCGEDVPVDFSCVRMMEEEAMLLELQCEHCEAYIVLHASLNGVEYIGAKPYTEDPMNNASSQLDVCKKDVKKLRTKLARSGGSFSLMFKNDDLSAEK